MLHRFPDEDEIQQRLQRAELDYVTSSQGRLDDAGRELHRDAVRMIAPTVAVVCVLALWQLVVGIGLLNEDHVPSMSATVAELAELLGDGDFWSAVGSTLQGWALGLGIAAVLAIPLGIVIGSSATAYRSVRFVVEFLRPIPSVALVPLAVLIYGVGPGEQGLPRRLRQLLAAVRADALRRPGRRPGGHRHRALVRPRPLRAALPRRRCPAPSPTSPPACASAAPSR